jgi:hypothetical protein
MNTNIVTLNPLELQTGIIAHLDFTAVMGTSIESTFFNHFYSQLKIAKSQPTPLGTINTNWFNSELCLVNLNALDSHNNIDYSALALAFSQLSQFSQKHHTMPFIPYGIGCGSFNGNWDKIHTLISQFCPHSLIWKFPKHQLKISFKPNSFTPKSNVIYLPSSIEQARLMA